MMKIVLLLALFSFSKAFVTSPQARVSTTIGTTHLFVSSLSDEPIIDKTEQLLLDRKERIDSGIVQRIGKTVLNDGLDGVRSVVWGLYNVAEVLFPFLGACMFVSLLLNVLGYGYYFDDNGHFLFNTLDYIRQEQFYQGEFAKFTANAAAQNHPSF